MAQDMNHFFAEEKCVRNAIGQLCLIGIQFVSVAQGDLEGDDLRCLCPKMADGIRHAILGHEILKAVGHQAVQ